MLTYQKIQKELEKAGFGYHVDITKDGFKFIYVYYGNVNNKEKFRPYMRLSIHNENPEKVYVRDCGYCEYRTLKDIINKLEEQELLSRIDELLKR